jgi:hypothetical protein
MKNKQNYGINTLIPEAIEISKELKCVVFVGAVGVYLHTRTTRESRDIDFAIATNISDEELREKGYKINLERHKARIYSPRDVKVDIYRNDVNNIPVTKIFQTSKDIQAARNKIIKAASLEVLIVTKYRTSRPQDMEDLSDIVLNKYSVIDWEALRTFTYDEHEFEMIKTSLFALKKVSVLDPEI